MDATRSLGRRAEQTQTPANQGNSSVFTFLIALLILLCTSAAVVFRALLMRRRLRNRIRNALDAGILLPARPIPEEKPLVWDAWIRRANNDQDWEGLLPVCATRVTETTSEETSPRPEPVYTTSSRRRRILDILRRRPPLSSATVQPGEPQKEKPGCSTVQVVVLIAMPSQQATIPTHHLSTSSSSMKGKEKDPYAHEDTDMDADIFPDVMFGISTFESRHEDNL